MVLRYEMRVVWPPFGAENPHLHDRSVAWRPDPTRRRRPRVRPDLTRSEARAADPTRPAEKARGTKAWERLTSGPTIDTTMTLPPRDPLNQSKQSPWPAGHETVKSQAWLWLGGAQQMRHKHNFGVLLACDELQLHGVA